MYEKSLGIPITNNASFVSRNISYVKHRDLTTFAIVSRNSINLTTVNKNGSDVEQKCIVPKISKDESSAALNGVDNMILANIIQAKYVDVAGRNILVVTATKGIFFFDEDASTLMYFHNFRNMKLTQIEETKYARGITVVGDNIIAIGTSMASVFLFEVPPKGNNIVMVEEITEKNLNNGITDLASDGNCLVASDTNGNIFGWHVRSEKSFKQMFKIRGNKAACTSIGLWRSYLLAGYGNGSISIYSLEDGKKFVDISAHARWIHCLDVTGKTFVTAGEDCYFRVWELDEINGRLKVNALHSELVTDTQITGICFNNGTDQICMSSFDNNQIIVYNSL